MKNKYFIFLISIFLFGFFLSASSIKITQPKGSISWEVGKKCEIRWIKSGPQDEFVKIRLFSRNGSKKRLAEKEKNDGSFNWIVSGVTPGEYKVRIKTKNNKVFCDSPYFKIKGKTVPIKKEIRIVYPSNGASWDLGKTYMIRWSSTGIGNDNVKIILLKFEKNVFMPTKVLDISTSVQGKTGYYSWNIPGSLKPGKYVIRVKTLNNLTSADSNEFNISGGNQLAGNNVIVNNNTISLQNQSPQTVFLNREKPVILFFKMVDDRLIQIPDIISRGRKFYFNFKCKNGSSVKITNRTTGKIIFQEKNVEQNCERTELASLEKTSRVELMVSNRYGYTTKYLTVRVKKEFKIFSFYIFPPGYSPGFYPGYKCLELIWDIIGAKNAWIDEIYGGKIHFIIKTDNKYVNKTRSFFGNKKGVKLCVNHPSKFKLYIQDSNNNIISKEIIPSVINKFFNQKIDEFRIAQNLRLDAVHIDVSLVVTGAKSLKIYEINKKTKHRRSVFSRVFDKSEEYKFSSRPFYKRPHSVGDSYYMLEVTWWDGNKTEKYADKL